MGLHKDYLRLCLAASIGASFAFAAFGQTAKTAACSSAEYRKFDFWIGVWDTFDYGGPPTAAASAHVRVEPILDGCALREEYYGATGAKGQSFTIYDQSRGVWHQSWVTNRGKLLTIEGRPEGDAMVLAGSDRTAEGKERKVRGTWKPVPGGVRETAVSSIDGGATWTPWFDLVFRPHDNATHKH